MNDYKVTGPEAATRETARMARIKADCEADSHGRHPYHGGSYRANVEETVRAYKVDLAENNVFDDLHRDRIEAGLAVWSDELDRLNA